MITLQNENLIMQIHPLGAEPQSLIVKETGIEYLWDGNKEYWFRHAPLLFPMTGPTKENKIAVNGNEYTMPNNGFARDTEFTLVNKTSNQATFMLEENEASLKNYPYRFSLLVTYTLLEDGYQAKAEIFAKEDLYFTFGWHPAFSLNINGEDTPLEAYHIEFDECETADRKYPIEGVFATEKHFLDNTKVLKLSRKETDKGPIVLNGLKSKTVSLVCDTGDHGVKVERGNLDTLVFWTCAPKQAQYLCIEPMHSFGDTTRPLELKDMKEVLFLEQGLSKTFNSTFFVF
ncbi:MAG: hypothetical protein WC136_07560 [Sphaerochaeta sp.]